LLSSRTGGEILIDASAAVILDHGGTVIGAVLAFRDVTLKTRDEEQIHKTQRLESIGVVAGGIAHDFNNLLTGIFGSISLARASLPSDAPALAWLDEASNVLEKARDLTSQLMTFSAAGRKATEPPSLAEILRRSVRFVLSGTNISSELSIPDDLWPCDIDPQQIRQAIDAIILNARQAMPEGGTVRIVAKNIAIPEGAAPRLSAGPYVEIAISDSGPGIPVEIQGRIFDPFFTTKKDRSGLGLTSVHSILIQHGGTIDLESPPSGGSTFRLRMQASDRSPPRRAANHGHPIEHVEGKLGVARILVVDDQPEVLHFMRTVLEHSGYTVDLAADAREAIALFGRAYTEGKPFACAILDLTIAGSPGGIEILAQMKTLDPGIRAIASSGYTSDDIMSDPRRFGFVGTLPKPYTILELSSAVASALRVEL
jgi:signal transduction histidine kinase/ActR/RegA family two-component response regulator